MRSLRNMCLLQVQSIALGQHMLDMTEIPPSLAKELKIMQLVNTSFEILCRDRFCGRDNVPQTALSIQYDGVFWNFCYRTRTNYKQQFTLEEGKPTPTQSPFWEASNLLEQLDQKASVNLRMIMNFEMNENEEGTWGNYHSGVLKTSLMFLLSSVPAWWWRWTLQGRESSTVMGFWDVEGFGRGLKFFRT